LISIKLSNSIISRVNIFFSGRTAPMELKRKALTGTEGTLFLFRIPYTTNSWPKAHVDKVRCLLRKVTFQSRETHTFLVHLFYSVCISLCSWICNVGYGVKLPFSLRISYFVFCMLGLYSWEYMNVRWELIFYKTRHI
jgi:hypothetical protein